MVEMSMRIHCIQLLLATLLKSSKVNTKEIDLQYKWRKLIYPAIYPAPQNSTRNLQLQNIVFRKSACFPNYCFTCIVEWSISGNSALIPCIHCKIHHTVHCNVHFRLTTAICSPEYYKEELPICQVYNTYSISFFFWLSVSVFSLITKKGIIHSARVWCKCGHSISVYDSLVNLLVCAHQLPMSCQKKFPSVVIVYFSQVYINLFWF